MNQLEPRGPTWFLNLIPLYSNREISGDGCLFVNKNRSLTCQVCQCYAGRDLPLLSLLEMKAEGMGTSARMSLRSSLPGALPRPGSRFFCEIRGHTGCGWRRKH